MNTKLTQHQVDRLRVQLAQYREAFQVGNELRSIDAVLSDMRECPEVPESFFGDFEPGKWKPLNNRLWRFVNRRGTPKMETLEALHRFLAYSAVELDGLPIEEDEVAAVHGFMANGSPEARRVFDAILDGEYVARRYESDNSRFVLTFTCDRKRMIVGVEEHFDTPDIRLNSTGTTTQRGTGTAIRKGYGFLSTERFLLHIFLVGSHARDRVHYVEMGAFVSTGHPYLLRIGGYTKEHERSSPPPDSTYPISLFDVLSFQSLALSEKEQAERKALEDEQSLRRRPPPPPMALQGPIPGLVWGVLPQGTRSMSDDLERGLLEAIQKNSFQHTRYWLKKGANPNLQDDAGMTPLHHAASLGSRTALRLLVSSGKCDYLIVDKLGRYPSDLAIEWSRDFAVARLLTRKRLQQAHAQGRPCREHGIKWHNPPRRS